MTSCCSFRVQSYTSSNPTLSLCESNAIDKVESISKKIPNQIANAIINQSPNNKIVPKSPKRRTSSNQPLRRKKPTAPSTSLHKQISNQLTKKPSIPHIPYQIYKTTVISKWRVDGEFTTCQQDIKVRCTNSNANINQPTKTNQHPNSLHQRPNPSEGKSQRHHQPTHKNKLAPKLPQKSTTLHMPYRLNKTTVISKWICGVEFTTCQQDIKVRYTLVYPNFYKR